MAHRTEVVGRGLLVTVFDEITDYELAQINAELCSFPELDRIEYCVRDLTAISKLSLTRDALDYAAFFNAVANSYKPNMKVAIVACDPATRRNVQFYVDESRVVGNNWDQRIFADKSSALAWARS